MPTAITRLIVHLRWEGTLASDSACLLNEIADAPRRYAPNSFEVSVQMALIREAASVSDFRDRHTAFEHTFRLANLTLDQISMRRHAVLAFERTQKLEGTQIYHCSELRQDWALAPALVEIFAHANDVRATH